MYVIDVCCTYFHIDFLKRHKILSTYEKIIRYLYIDCNVVRFNKWGGRRGQAHWPFIITSAMPWIFEKAISVDMLVKWIILAAVIFVTHARRAKLTLLFAKDHILCSIVFDTFCANLMYCEQRRLHETMHWDFKGKISSAITRISISRGVNWLQFGTAAVVLASGKKRMNF